MLRYCSLLLLLPWPLALTCQGTPATPAAGPDQQVERNQLVQRALANELHAAQDTGHPMRYRLRKTSPRLPSTKLLVETKDGQVARLVSINGQL